jgi:hypothetical protein
MESKTNPWTSVIVKTPDGESTQLATRWQNAKTILYLVRRFGCAYCQHQGSVIMELKHALDKAGVNCNYVAVGGGTKWASDKFKFGTPWEGEILLDATHATHKAMKLQRFSVWQAMRRYYLSHKTLQFSKGLYDRFKHSDFVGDAMQSGGVFVLGPGTNSAVEYSFVEAEGAADAVCDVFAMYKSITGRDLSQDEYRTIHEECVKQHAQAMSRLQVTPPASSLSSISTENNNTEQNSGNNNASKATDKGPAYASVAQSPHDHHGNIGNMGGFGGGGSGNNKNNSSEQQQSSQQSQQAAQEGYQPGSSASSSSSKEKENVAITIRSREEPENETLLV